MIRNFQILGLFLFSNYCLSQSFAPPAGQPGSTAIHKDSSIFVDWAKTCIIERGLANISDPNEGYATFGYDSIAIGPASGSTTSVVSLGDGGKATLTFNTYIINGEGPDFAVFENGFSDTFLELAFVEVSSDGVRFVRFPAISELSTTTQIGGFGSIDCRYIHNFAGKYRVGYGTPFDLEDIKDSSGIDLNAITHVRIVDVVGSIDPAYATYDSQGNVVNDPFPTPFPSGGFDLDAVGVINARELNSDKLFIEKLSIFPNPTKDEIYVISNQIENFTIHSITGEKLLEGQLELGKNKININELTFGIYFINTDSGKIEKIIKH